jgi:Na+-driven multidrug efflux pump
MIRPSNLLPSIRHGTPLSSPGVAAAGSDYLTAVGPFFGCFGAAFTLYCAAQGAGRMGWPLTGAFLRTAVAILGGFAAVRLEPVFWSVGAGMAAFASLAALSLVRHAGYREAMQRKEGAPSRLRIFVADVT